MILPRGARKTQVMKRLLLILIIEWASYNWPFYDAADAKLSNYSIALNYFNLL